MKNYISSGDTVTLVAPTGGVVAGTAVKIGQIVAVPATTVAAAALFEGVVRGIFDLAKVSAQAWTVGQIIYFDSAAGLFTTVSATGNVIVGQAMAIAANPSATGRVRLDGAVRASV